jgi:putative transposase
MPQSLSKVIIHIILARRIESHGWTQMLPRTVSQAELVEGIKKPSSKWIKALEARYSGFFWQRGYGAFSVSPSQLDAVLQYVQTQEEHHRTRAFQEEYRELLRRHGVEFDERYAWD